MVGEIGGDEEEKAARYIGAEMSKPVVAYIAGFTAPPGKTMGHAGAIISGSSGTAEAKKEALEAAGVRVGTTPTEVAELAARDRRHAQRLRNGERTAELLRGRPLMSGPDSRVRLVESISLARGVPAPECLALEELADCARAAIERDGATVLNYGPAGGYGPLRDWIADRHRVEPERVVLTNGSLQGFRFLAELLAPNGTVIVEAPTYDRPLKILDDLDAEVICVPLDEEPTIEEGAFLYTIPTFQNPTGKTLPLERRKQLADLAKGGLLVLEDDPYGLVRFEGEALPTVFELTKGRNVVYSSSFSKTVAPGLRVGYLVLPAELVDGVVAAATSSYITPALLSQATVYEFLRRGAFEPNLERVRGLLRERRDAMVAALERHLPEATLDRPRGRLLPVGRPPRGRGDRGPAPGGCDVRSGIRLLLRTRGRKLVASRVQLRVARGDRGSGSPSGVSRPRRDAPAPRGLIAAGTAATPARRRGTPLRGAGSEARSATRWSRTGQSRSARGRCSWR